MCLFKENTVKRSLHVQRTSQASQLARKLHLTIARDFRSRGGTRVLLARALLLLRFSKRRLTRYNHEAYRLNQTCDCRRFVLQGTIRVIGLS